jgi:cold shock CspA family protein
MSQFIPQGGSMHTNSKLTRVGIFYDGYFLLHVSNYYQYHHERRSRISISGLHEFIRHEAANWEGVDARYSQIVDAHYFRGRLRAADAEQRDLLYRERVFDDVLMREGVTTHYLPMVERGERGIDVWLALEAFEMAIYKRFDVTVLVACDGDFLPLVRKLNTLGTRVMVLAWDFNYTDQNGEERETRTAQTIVDEATYPVMMHTLIDDRARRNDSLISGLFVPRKEGMAPGQYRTAGAQNVAAVGVGAAVGGPVGFGAGIPGAAQWENGATPPPAVDPRPGYMTGAIQNLKNGYGFIVPDNGEPNLFFFHSEVTGVDFNELAIGDRVDYLLGENERGSCARDIRALR